MFSLGLVMLTLIRAIQNWRININSSSLFVVLVKHNIFYYTCGFCELILARAVFPCSFMIISLSWSVLGGEHNHATAPPGTWMSQMPVINRAVDVPCFSTPTTRCCTSMHFHILLRIPTNNIQTYTCIQFPGHHSCDPRHTHAPLSLADSKWLWHPCSFQYLIWHL
jgi:hypothetical protein